MSILRNNVGRFARAKSQGFVASKRSLLMMSALAATSAFALFHVAQAAPQEADKALQTTIHNCSPRPTPPVVARRPIGKRYKIEGAIVATNTFDGIGDNTVEVKGKLRVLQLLKTGIKDTTMVEFAPPHSMSQGQEVKFGPFYIDSVFADVPTASYVISGYFTDVDENGKEDPMMTRDRQGKLQSDSLVGPITLKGDGNRESLDVIYTVTAVKDLYPVTPVK